MKKCIFTIVAQNYIGLAQILEKSIKRHESTDFFIIVADELQQMTLPNNIVIAKDSLGYDTGQWIDMAYKYNLTEFCTAIKPAAFQYLIQQGYDEVIYFDPDIYVFSPLTKIWEELQSHDMVLTPHVAGIHPHYQGEDEWAICVTGIFNLGFCAVHNSPNTQSALTWWKKRLETQAFCNRAVGTFTDQKWMDWMPALMGDRLYVLRDLGANLAPWNFFERKIIQTENMTLQVCYRYDDCVTKATPLIFMHFSGYDYALLMQGIVTHQRLKDPLQYSDIELATTQYSKALMENSALFNAFEHQTYSYDVYDNGEKIENFHRKLYNGYVQYGEQVENPFSTGRNSFYARLKKHNLLSDKSIDKLTPKNYQGLESKIKILDRFFALLCSIIGYKRYTLFIKSLYRYAQVQNHSFLIKK